MHTTASRATREAWRRRRAPEPRDPEVRRAFASPVPLRCPRSFIKAGLLRLDRLRCERAKAALRSGTAFCCDATDLIGDASTPLRRWDVAYLARHLPKDMRFGVIQTGTQKIIMTHTLRYTKDSDPRERRAAKALELGDERFAAATRSMVSFDEFVRATEAWKAAPAHTRGEPPYFGCSAAVTHRNSP